MADQIPKGESHWPLSLLMGLASLLNIILPLALVRMLSPQDVGLYKLFFLYASTATWLFLAAGLSNSYYYWIGDRESKTLFSGLFTLQLCLSALILTVGAALAFALTAFTSGTWSISSLLLLIVAASLQISGTSFEDSEIAQGRTTRAARFGASFEFARTVSLLLAAFVFRSVNGIFFAHVGITSLKWVASTALLYRNQIKFSFASIQKKLFSYAFPSSLAATLLVIVNYGDQFILGRFLDPASFAAYSLGCLSIPPLLIFEQSVNKVLIPKLSMQLSAKTYREAVEELSAWLIPSAIGLSIFARPIVRLLFTDRYPAAETYLQFYAFSYAFYAIPYDAWARANGQTRWILKTTAAFAGLSLLALSFGVWQAGAIGALVSFLIVQLGLRVYSLIAMTKRTGWKLRDAVPFLSIVLFTVASILIGAFSWLVSQMFSHELPGLLVGGISFWLLYIATALVGRERTLATRRRSKKVLMLTQLLNVGGLETMILNLSRDLIRRSDWTPIVCVYDKMEGTATLDDAFTPEIELIRLSKGPSFSLKLAWRLARLTARREIDVIHAHDIGPLIYGVLAKLLSLGRIRVVFTQHSFVHLQQRRRNSWYERIFSRLCDQLCAVSESVRDQYIKLGLRRTQIEVIENGVPFVARAEDTDTLMAERQALLESLNLPGDLAKKRWLLSLARLHRGKGQDTLIKIWHELPPDVRSSALLFFVGGETFPETLQNLKALAADSADLIFTGSSKTPSSWLRVADVFLSGSAQEGLPLGPIEAIGAGLPVFLSDIVGHRIFGDSATFFDLNNPKDAARQLTALLERTSNQKSSAPSLILERFALARMTDHYLLVYNRMIGEL